MRTKLLVFLFIFLLGFYFFGFDGIKIINNFRQTNQTTATNLSEPELQNKLNTISSEVGKKYKYPPLPNLKFIFLDEGETDPVLKDTFEDMEKRQIMMANDEDYYPVMKKLNLNPTITVFVNKNMLFLYSGMNIDPSNLTEREEIIGKVIFHEGEHIKQQKIVDISAVNFTLYDLFWQDNPFDSEGKKPTPANKLLEALSDARLDLETTPNYNGEEIENEIKQKETQYTRLNQIYNLYKNLMGKLDDNKPLEKQKTQEFIKKLEDLNKNPSQEELQLLRLN